MPIRFRCRFCNQLMGIAHRKAGMTVNCPTCHGQLIVPQPDSADPPEPRLAEDAGEAAAAPLFERSDFEAFLQAPVPEAPPPQIVKPLASVPPFAQELPSSPSFVPAARSPQPAGLVLSPTQATWLTVVAILLLALAFGLGLLVGHYWMGG